MLFRSIIQQGQIAGLTVWYAAVAGTTVPTTAPFPIGATAMRPTASTAWASAFVGFPLDFCFLFFLPFAKVKEKQESFTLRTQWGCRGILPPAIYRNAGFIRPLHSLYLLSKISSLRDSAWEDIGLGTINYVHPLVLAPLIDIILRQV